MLHGYHLLSDEFGMNLPTIVRLAKFPNSRARSFDQERREVLDSVLGAWQTAGTRGSDPDRLAACHYLLRHLMAEDRADWRHPAGGSRRLYA